MSINHYEGPSSARRYAPRRWRGAVAAIVAVTLGVPAVTARAQESDTLATGVESLGHVGGDLPNKRIEGSGEGMPSVLGPFPDTLNMTFLGQVTNADMGLERLVFTGATFLSDIWGWTSPATGDEYAIVGTTSGVAFVRVTDPTAPEFLGLVPTTDVPTTRNFWWDIKTFNNHAYWVTEVNNAGVAIFDLTRLDALSAAPPETRLQEDARFRAGGADGYVRAHNIAINEATGRGYLIGVTQAGLTDDAIVILDLTGDPLAPQQIGVVDGVTAGVDVDSHDAQAVSYIGPDPDHQGEEILINFNGNALNIQFWNVTDPTAPLLISQTTYPGASFTHQGWLTEDHAYLFAGDEEDELFGLQDPRNPLLPDTARTYICDVSDLDSPDCTVGFFDSPAASIDHNLFVKNADGRELVYQAHYTAGVRVLEFDRGLGQLAEVAHMDTEPRLPNKHMNRNINIFVGPWGVFPFFDSGTIAASDGLNGLILMELDLP